MKLRTTTPTSLVYGNCFIGVSESRYYVAMGGVRSCRHYTSILENMRNTFNSRECHIIGNYFPLWRALSKGVEP
jgi:hypothetical protein